MGMGFIAFINNFTHKIYCELIYLLSYIKQCLIHIYISLTAAILDLATILDFKTFKKVVLLAQFAGFAFKIVNKHA